MFRGPRPAAVQTRYLTDVALCPSSSLYVTQGIHRAEIPHLIHLFHSFALQIRDSEINVPCSKGTESSVLCYLHGGQFRH